MDVGMQLRGVGRVLAAVSFGALVLIGWQAATSASPRAAGQDYPGECPTSTTDYAGYAGYEGDAVPQAYRVGAQDYPGCETTTTITTGDGGGGTGPDDTVFPSDDAGTVSDDDALARTGPPDFTLPLVVAGVLIAVVVGSGALVRIRAARS